MKTDNPPPSVAAAPPAQDEITLKDLGVALGLGDSYSDSTLYQHLYSREWLLRQLLIELETHKSSAATTEEAVQERLTALAPAPRQEPDVERLINELRALPRWNHVEQPIMAQFVDADDLDAALNRASAPLGEATTPATNEDVHASAQRMVKEHRPSFDKLASAEARLLIEDEAELNRIAALSPAPPTCRAAPTPTGKFRDRLMHAASAWHDGVLDQWALLHQFDLVIDDIATPAAPAPTDEQQ